MLCGVVAKGVGQLLSQGIHIRVGGVNALVEVGDGLVGNLVNLLVQHFAVHGLGRVGVQCVGNGIHGGGVVDVFTTCADRGLDGGIVPGHIFQVTANRRSFANHQRD